jgi:hypothetical protein
MALPLKAIFALLCLAVLVSHLLAMSRWNEARGVYDDICYLRQAHLFQRFGLKGFDTDISRDDDGYLTAKLKEVGYPTWNDAATAPCHNPMPATKKLVIQYPPGVGMVLAVFPAGHQVAPMYMLATLAVFAVAMVALFLARTISSIVMVGIFGCVAVYLMINPVKASYSMAPTVLLCALAGFLTAGWLAWPERGSKTPLIAALGFLFGLGVDFRLANLFLASGYGLYLLVSFLTSRKALQFWQGVAFAVAFMAGMAPTLVSYAINTGSPLTSTYSGAPDVKPLDLTFSAFWGYLQDPLQVVLLVLGIGGALALLRRDDGTRRVAQLTLANLAVNLAFFLTYPIATPYYTIPIALLSLWSLLFALVMQETESGERYVLPRPTNIQLP